MTIFKDSQFRSKDEMFLHIRNNKDSILAEKRSTTKYADSMAYSSVGNDANITMIGTDIIKANEAIPNYKDLDSITVVPVINTTNYLDSHRDVHIPKLWKKSLQENKNIVHLQEHRRDFASVIASKGDLKAYTSNLSWSDLGKDYNGNTEALMFNSIVRKERNEFMFDQYAKGYVDQHSVGMQYVMLYLCMNSDSKYDKDERDNWEKYVDKIANKEALEQCNYFYAITEAKVMEGSAVLFGSNPVTPTMENNKSIIIEPEKSLDYGSLIKAVNEM